MVRRLFIICGLLLVGGAVGCGICQNCLDRTGPVLEAPNGGDYYDSPRVNSGLGGAPVHGEEIIEGEEMPVYEEEYAGQPAPGAPATATRMPVSAKNPGQPAQPYPGAARR